MGERFDPYLQWLGIRDGQRPPNHYRLLGLEPFESDANIIQHAADRQMAHVRTFQAGKHAEACQSLLNELAAARLCLLDADAKAAYDTELRKQSAPRRPPKPAPEKPADDAPGPVIAAAHSHGAIPQRRKRPLSPLGIAGLAVAAGLLLVSGLALITLLMEPADTTASRSGHANEAGNRNADGATSRHAADDPAFPAVGSGRGGNDPPTSDGKTGETTNDQSAIAAAEGGDAMAKILTSGTWSVALSHGHRFKNTRFHTDRQWTMDWTTLQPQPMCSGRWKIDGETVIVNFQMGDPPREFRCNFTIRNSNELSVEYFDTRGGKFDGRATRDGAE